MYTRPFYLLLTVLGLLTTLFYLNTTLYPYFEAANANPLADISSADKRIALRRAIIDGLLANNERSIEFISTPCVSSLDISDRSIDSSPDLSLDESINDGTYHCVVTAKSGTQYDAEIELLVINEEIWDMPALLTLIDNEESFEHE